MNPSIEHCEKILNKVILNATDLLGACRYGNFRYEDSLHSFITAPGKPTQRLACFCKDKIFAEFNLPKFRNDDTCKSRFLLKLTAAWENWKLYSHNVKIIINGNTLLDSKLFLENVCTGWPSVYFSVPLDYLQAGPNRLEISNCSGGKNTLVINRVEILRQTDLRDFTIQSCPDFVIKNEEFKIVLTMLQTHRDMKLSYKKNLVKNIMRFRLRF